MQLKTRFAVIFIAVAFTQTIKAQVRVAPYGPSPECMTEQMLRAHNTVRKQMGIRALVWSEQLAEYAQEWADYLLASGEFKHRTDHRYGENLYAIVGASAKPEDVVREWASEAAQYDYKANVCMSEKCGHYTQVVWRQSRAVGCAVARETLREIWVCNYNPPGNVIGERPY